MQTLPPIGKARHREDQEALDRMAKICDQVRAGMSPEELQAMTAGDQDLFGNYPRHPILDHPASNPKTQKNLTTLLDVHQQNGEAGLTKRFDQVCLDSTIPKTKA